MMKSDFGEQWVTANSDRDDGVTVQELEQLWTNTAKPQRTQSGGWFSDSDGPTHDKSALQAKTEDVVAQLDVDKDGKLGLVEWTVQHALIEAYLNSRRFATTELE